ncbi:unnamed protein product [Ranitomeya imitator]|uniref:Choline transporter-like protein n=1 Tax=Ranitomeya imitator TaxID=111125 RepID=A0ABN9MDQ0_9NEOB|nr:unnamed protein product [Ranitomeya imitator]
MLQVFISGYALMAGATERLIFGYDSYGNVCGRRNSPIPNAPFSGKDMTSRNKCFRFIVSLSKSFPLFNRCVPQNPDCYSKFASVLIDVINEVDFFHRILSGIMAGRDNVVGLSILAVVDRVCEFYSSSSSPPALSIVMVISFRYISTLLVHIFVTLLMFGLLFVTGVLWWLYYDHIHDLSYELETEKENAKFLLGFAIISTLISIVLFVLTFLMRRRIQMTIQLFQVASSFISHIPFLLLQPLWTFLILLFYWILWVSVLLSMGTSGESGSVFCSAQVSSDGQVEYTPLGGIRYMWWYHLFGLIWTSDFFLTCQQFLISGATVTWFLHSEYSRSVQILQHSGGDFMKSHIRYAYKNAGGKPAFTHMRRIFI